jgi:hypothetical protein
MARLLLPASPAWLGPSFLQCRDSRLPFHITRVTPLNKSRNVVRSACTCYTIVIPLFPWSVILLIALALTVSIATTAAWLVAQIIAIQDARLLFHR